MRVIILLIPQYSDIVRKWDTTVEGGAVGRGPKDGGRRGKEEEGCYMEFIKRAITVSVPVKGAFNFSDVSIAFMYIQFCEIQLIRDCKKQARDRQREREGGRRGERGRCLRNARFKIVYSSRQES